MKNSARPAALACKRLMEGYQEDISQTNREILEELEEKCAISRKI